MVQKADRNRRFQREVIFAFMKLLLMQPGRVVQDSLFVIGVGEHLHFDVELSSGLIAGFDIQDRQFVVQGRFRVEGIEKLDFANVVGLEPGCKTLSSTFIRIGRVASRPSRCLKA
jgi:hypothetical protein